jgi:hypothetical protein
MSPLHDFHWRIMPPCGERLARHRLNPSIGRHYPQGIADALNARGISTPPRGGRWHPASVARVIDRVSA